MGHYRVGDVARIVNVSVRSLHHHDEIGLLVPRERLGRTERLLEAIEREMEVMQMGMSLTPEEQLEVFGTNRLDEYSAEARQRWGDTAAWKESRRRAAAHTKAFHRGLAEMYVADPRFAQTYEAVAPGLARYVHDAIVANAERAAAG